MSEWSATSTSITDALVMPADVLLTPVTQLSDAVRSQLAASPDDFAATRLRSRTPSRLVDASAANLLEQFRTPTTIVEAVIRLAAGTGVDPESLLEDAYPAIEHLLSSGLLAVSSAQHPERSPTYGRGDRLDGLAVLNCVSSIEDTHVYQVETAIGSEAAAKLFVGDDLDSAMHRAEMETAILRRLDGGVAPRLLRTGTAEGRPYLLMEWCPGVDPTRLASELRNDGDASSVRELLTLCCRILRVYDRLHSAGVVHGDVHPRNLIIDNDGSVRIVDFGLARTSRGRRSLAPHRGGVAFFLEPEYARSYIHRSRLAPTSFRGEQYSLGALIYLLITGQYYLNFSLDKESLLVQIVNADPIRFAECGAADLPEVEHVVVKALSKDPRDRYKSTGRFADELERCLEIPDSPNRLLTQTAHPASGAELVSKLVADLGFEGQLLATGVSAGPKCSVNYGAAGVAYALHRMAMVRQDAGLLSLADVWATRAMQRRDMPHAFEDASLGITPDVAGDISIYHSPTGICCVQALIAHAMGDIPSQYVAADQFVALCDRATTQHLDLTLGRSGALLGCALLLEAMPACEGIRDFGRTLLADIGRRVEGNAVVGVDPSFPYIGVAHGWAGIVYAALTWCAAAAETVPPFVGERLAQLSRLAERHGRGYRWPVTLVASRRHAAHMPGWCHGSAGHVFLWIAAHQLFDDSRYAQLAEGAAWNVWEAQNAGDSLCCGRSGQAYALLAFTGRVEIAIGSNARLSCFRRQWRRATQSKGQVKVFIKVASASQFSRQSWKLQNSPGCRFLSCTAAAAGPKDRPWEDDRTASAAGFVVTSAVSPTPTPVPSWAIVAEADRTINPDLERWYATRANSWSTSTGSEANVGRQLYSARKLSSAGFTSSGCVQAMLCGPPSTLTSLRLLMKPGSRAAVALNGRIRSAVPWMSSVGTSIFGRSARKSVSQVPTHADGA